MLRLDTSLRAAAKALDAAVTKALDHGVYLYAIQATSGSAGLKQPPCARAALAHPCASPHSHVHVQHRSSVRTRQRAPDLFAFSFVTHNRRMTMSLEEMTKIDNLKSWTSGVEVEWEAVQQLRNIAA